MQNRTSAHSWQRQRGFSLTEILVAVAIFTIIMVAALTLYDRSNKVFKQANEAAEMQQNTRVAFEKIVSEVRMAGFDYKRAGIPSYSNPTVWVADRQYTVGALVTPIDSNNHVYVAISVVDGADADTIAGESGGSEPSWTTGSGDEIPDNEVTWKETGVPIYEQPDEQIEFVGESAITLRANFDYNDGTANKGRETDLENAADGHFPVITTGNDEIVTYALRSMNADANDDDLVFYADVNNGGTPDRAAYPGGSPERAITIPDVDFSNANPPYQLMRFTLSDAGAVQGVAIADNIRSMKFEYWEDYAATVPLADDDGNAISDLDGVVGGDGLYDPDDPDEFIVERALRSKVRAVTVTLTGMNPQLDREYTHPTDLVATNYRQYELKSTIVGRNLGLQGVPQEESDAPDAPTLDAVCYGYCGIAVVSWTPAEGTIDTTYTVLVDDDEDGSFSKAFSAGTQTRFAVDMTQLDITKTWYFRVAATNAGGTTLSEETLDVSIKNSTKPGTPVVTASIGTAASPIPNQINLSWTLPSANASGNPSCNPVSATPFYSTNISTEIKGFRIYRSSTTGFTPDASNMIHREGDTGVTYSSSTNTYSYTDTSVANCENYYYRIVTVEWCDDATENTGGNAALGVSDASVEVAGKAYSDTQAKAPTNFKYNAMNECSDSGNTCHPVELSWNAVTQDEDENTIIVTDYLITRVQRKGVNGTIMSTTEIPVNNVTSTTYTDNGPLEEHHADLTDYYYHYTVKAVYGNGDCDVEGLASAELVYPGACSTWAEIEAEALGGTGEEDDPWTDTTTVVVSEHPDRALTSVQYVIDPQDDGTDVWMTLNAPYEYEWVEVTDGDKHEMRFRLTSAECAEEFQSKWIQNDAPSCTPTAVARSVSTNELQTEIVIKNIESEALTLQSFSIQWAGETGLAWTTITLPSATTKDATGTTTENPTQSDSAARTVKFDGFTGSDQTIAANSTYSVKMTYTGTGTPSSSANINDVLIVYQKASIPNTDISCTASPLTVCNVTSTVATHGTDSSTLVMTLTNNTSEDLIVSEIKLGHLGRNKWTWDGITLGGDSGTFQAASPAVAQGAAATRTFTLASPITVPRNGTYTINIDHTKTGSGAAAALVGTDIDVAQITYSTTSSSISPSTNMICITH